MRKLFVMLLILLCCGCYKQYLFVQHEKIDKSELASVHVNTPDPRLRNPPEGQKISISWDFPLSVYREDLTLILTVRFWDNKQDVFVHKVDKKRGYKIFKFQEAMEEDSSKKILTYKIEVINEDGNIVQVWEHQFWKKRIDINQNNQEQIFEKKQTI